MAHSSQYFFTLLSTICFGASTLVFTEYSNKVNAIWMNCVKAVVALVACFLVIPIFYGWHPVSKESILSFLFSGSFALCLGDILLLKAFQRIGPGRTLVLFGFHPLTLGIASYFVFNQGMPLKKLWAVLFLIGCLVAFSYEKFKKDGKWEFKGFAMALAAVSMDATGVVFTRLGFDFSTQIVPLEGHFYRSLGACLGFIGVQLFVPFGFIRNWKILTKRDQGVVLLGSFFGTFLSLWLYFIALQVGHLASVTALMITSPFIATIFECLYYRRPPTVYLVVAFLFFIAGFSILIG